MLSTQFLSRLTLSLAQVTDAISQRPFVCENSTNGSSRQTSKHTPMGSDEHNLQLAFCKLVMSMHDLEELDAGQGHLNASTPGGLPPWSSSPLPALTSFWMVSSNPFTRFACYASPQTCRWVIIKTLSTFSPLIFPSYSSKKTPISTRCTSSPTLFASVSVFRALFSSTARE